jgi:hypothetical protein
MMGWQGKEVHFDIINRLVFDELTKSSIEIPHYAKLKPSSFTSCSLSFDKGDGMSEKPTNHIGKPITWGGLDFTNSNANNITSNSTQISHDEIIKNKQESYQIEISDTEIDKAAMASMEEIYHSPNDTLSFYIGWNRAIKWYREQLKLKK